MDIFKVAFYYVDIIAGIFDNMCIAEDMWHHIDIIQGVLHYLIIMQYYSRCTLFFGWYCIYVLLCECC